MSTVVMGLCWPIQIPPTQKAVLISLADQANDHGSCWPSIAGIAERTCFGRTAVIAALQWLEEAGFISIEKTGGRNNRYQVDLAKLRQREIEPVRQTNQYASRTSPRGDQTSPPPALPPVRQPDQPVRQPDTNHQEPSSLEKKEEKVAHLKAKDLTAEGVSAEAAEEFMALRKRKKAPLTPLAWRMLKAEAVKAGWELDAAVRKAVQRGWQTFEAAWVEREGSKAAAGKTYRERDADAAARRNDEMTGGLLRQFGGANFIDMEDTNAPAITNG